MSVESTPGESSSSSWTMDKKNNSSGSGALGFASRSPSCHPPPSNDGKSGAVKDLALGASTKFGRAARYGGGRRRNGNSQWGGNSQSPCYGGAFHGLAQVETPSKRQNNLKGGSGSFVRREPYDNFACSSSPSPDAKCGKPMRKENKCEVGSIFGPGGKKQNLNHLFFEYQTSGRGKKYGRDRGFGHQNRIRKNSSGHRPKYDKDRFLQANCQFVVRQGENYSQHLTDPDMFVNWEWIEQVCLKTFVEVPSCPICLEIPSAAKITRCGHSYCWTCILHYFSLSDDASRPCPVCNSTIERRDLKSVVFVTWECLKVDSMIEMQLMRRERNSLFALPVNKYNSVVNAKHPTLDQLEDTSYSQLLTGTPDDIMKHVICREYEELEIKYAEFQADGDARICYVEEALQYLSERAAGKDFSGFETKIGLSSAPEPSDVTVEYMNTTMVNDVNETARTMDADGVACYTSIGSDGASVEENINDGGEVPAHDLDISSMQPGADQPLQPLRSGASSSQKSSKSLPKETFYFYQSSDGQPIFLHALNVQMLVTEYGSLEACPPFIRGKILEKEATYMTEELRNKLRYLRHVPLSCAIEVAEIEMADTLISQETMQGFYDQLSARQRSRKRRERNELRRERRIQVEENKLMGKFPAASNLRIESEFHFPPVGQVLSNLPADDSSKEHSAGEADAWGCHNGGPSFAKMLRDGVAKPIKQPGLTKSETFPLLSLKPSFTVPRRTRQQSDSEPENEEYTPPPQETIGDALASAMEHAVSLQNIKDKNELSAVTLDLGKKKGKKLKGKKIILGGAARPQI